MSWDEFVSGAALALHLGRDAWRSAGKPAGGFIPYARGHAQRYFRNEPQLVAAYALIDHWAGV